MGDLQYEPRMLIDGELVEVEVPRRQHERIVAQLCFSLTAWANAVSVPFKSARVRCSSTASPSI